MAHRLGDSGRVDELTVVALPGMGDAVSFDLEQTVDAEMDEEEEEIRKKLTFEKHKQVGRAHSSVCGRSIISTPVTTISS
jgi:hypothetical protein